MPVECSVLGAIVLIEFDANYVALHARRLLSQIVVTNGDRNRHRGNVLGRGRWIAAIDFRPVDYVPPVL